MANYTKTSDETNELFKEVLSKTTIPNWIDFELLNNSKLKQLYRISKLSDPVEVISGVNFLIIINEEIFDQLPMDQKIIALDECLTGVSVNENDKVSLETEDIKTHSGVLAKYGDDQVIRFKESVKSLFDEKQQREEEEKQQKKEAKKDS